MTAARTARRKAIRLGRRSSVGDDPVRPIAPHSWLTTTAGQRLDALSARPAVLQCPAARRCHPILLPSAPSQQRLLRPNPHRACCNRPCPLSAISRLGASRTPAVGARGWPRHAGVRETCTRAAIRISFAERLGSTPKEPFGVRSGNGSCCPLGDLAEGLGSRPSWVDSG